MVTTAFSDSQGLDLSPPSRLGRPVPPPKHPTLILRSCIGAQLHRVEKPLSILSGGRRPREPPCAFARGGPCAPLRSGDSLARSLAKNIDTDWVGGPRSAKA